jgi:hypothetical protein
LKFSRRESESHGPDHSNVARDLNNPASLLQATDPLAEAESLTRQYLEIFLQFTVATNHKHPRLDAAIKNYATFTTVRL